eukprot:gene5128-5368_t
MTDSGVSLLSPDQAWADPTTRRLYVKVVLGLLAGTALEFYDFAVYSQLGKFVGPNFFPAGNVYAEQLSFWAAYAVAFVVRPLGALLFGHVGDKHSRKKSLIYSLMLMAVPTTLMGCLPTFKHISWAAPVLLVLLRLFQGLAIGGENGTALVYLYEIAPTKRRCFLVALGWSGVPFGVALGMAVVLCKAVIQEKPGVDERLVVIPEDGVCQHEALKDVESIAVKVDPKELTGMGQSSSISSVPTAGRGYWPMVEMLRSYWLPVLLQWTWEFWFAAAFVSYSTYMPSFLAANVPGMSRALSLGSTMVNLICVMMTAWLTGYCCDRGMPRMTASGAVYLIAGATLAPAALAVGAGGVAAAWLMQLWFLVLVGVIGGLMAVSMCPLYPPEVRTSGMNFAHQLAFGPVGGLTPMILAAVKYIGGDAFMATVPWLAGCAAVSLVAATVLYYKYPQSNKDVDRLRL